MVPSPWQKDHLEAPQARVSPFSRMQALITDRGAGLPDRRPPGLKHLFQMRCFLGQPSEHPWKPRVLKTKLGTWCPHIRRGPAPVLLEEEHQLPATNKLQLRHWLPGWLVCGDHDSPFYGFHCAAKHFTFSKSIIAAVIISPFLTET